MFPKTATISENRFNSSGNSSGNNSSSSSSLHYSTFALSNNARHRSLSEEEQHLYNHHIIENFVESVREMNDVVLIPSKLKDLDSTTPSTVSRYVVLNDDLYSYYQMINVVKNDLFEPHNNESKKSLFLAKRKISRREQGLNAQARNVSSSSLTALLNNGYANGNVTSSNGQPANNGQSTANSTPPPQDGSSAAVNGSTASLTSLASNDDLTNGGTSSNFANGVQSSTPLMPLTSDQLIGQNSKQLTFQFIHHLHSLYTILEHFTSAADFITERYQSEVETLV